MQITPINNLNFEAKNTFLQKSKNTANNIERDLFLSYHHEAVGKLHYRKFLDAKHNLKEIGTPNTINKVSDFIRYGSKLVYEKFKSICSLAKACQIYPERF